MQRHSFFRKIAILSLLGCMLGTPSLYSEQQVLNAMVAVVNDDVITFSQVQELVGAQENLLTKPGSGLSGEALRNKIVELRTAAVNELIDEQLILQEFKKMQAKGASIPDYVLESHIQGIIRTKFNGDRAAFIRTLDAEGFTLARYKEIEMEKIIISGMQERFARTDPVIPPRAVDEYYAKHHEDYSIPDEIHLRMIVLNKSGATDATQKALAEEIRQKVASGAEFGKMAQLYSQSRAESEGDWGWINRKELNEQLTKVAFSLKPGQISSVVDSEGSYYLLQVVEKKNGGAKALKDVRAEIEQRLILQEQQKQRAKWIAGLRQKAYIKTF